MNGPRPCASGKRSTAPSRRRRRSARSGLPPALSPSSGGEGRKRGGGPSARRSRAERADLVVRFRGDPAEGSGIAHGEHWVVDFKTGAREEGQEETDREQVRGYMEILAGAWSVPVRGVLWYVETGDRKSVV